MAEPELEEARLGAEALCSGPAGPGLARYGLCWPGLLGKAGVAVTARSAPPCTASFKQVRAVPGCTQLCVSVESKEFVRTLNKTNAFQSSGGGCLQ